MEDVSKKSVVSPFLKQTIHMEMSSPAFMIYDICKTCKY